jgi:hypothetical protein
MRARAAALLLAVLGLAGCADAPPRVAELLEPRAAAPAEERRFEGVGAEQVQQAVVAVLQDLGFQLSASEPAIGLIAGTRGQAFTAGRIASDFGRAMGESFKYALTFQWHRKPDPARFGQTGFSAVVTITPLPAATAVRLSLHRRVSRLTGEPVVTWAEEVPGPQAHRDFFALLGKTLRR